jgi:hypothetical protein
MHATRTTPAHHCLLSCLVRSPAHVFVTLLPIYQYVACHPQLIYGISNKWYFSGNNPL